MSTPSAEHVTGMLLAWGQGDAMAAQLMRRVLVDAARKRNFQPGRAG